MSFHSLPCGSAISVSALCCARTAPVTEDRSEDSRLTARRGTRKRATMARSPNIDEHEEQAGQRQQRAIADRLRARREAHAVRDERQR